MYYSYVIYSPEANRFYYGFGDDLEKIEHAHNSGLVEYTRDARPWVLLYHESFPSRIQAIKRSKFYRGAPGQRYLKNILKF